MLTRSALATLCRKLSEQEPGMYRAVSVSTIQKLEAALLRPKLSTARTLIDALESSMERLFPLGHDEPRRNPTGKTRIEPGRKKGGRPPN